MLNHKIVLFTLIKYKYSQSFYFKSAILSIIKGIKSDWNLITF